MRRFLSVGVILISATLGGVAVADSTDSAPLTLSQLVKRSLASGRPQPRQRPRIEPDRSDPSIAKLDLLHTSIVARDWRGAFAISGAGSLLSDSFRLTRSSRMMVGRITLGNWRLVPFAHLGLGEWRTDRDFLPFMPRNQEFATQFSGGIELRISKQTRLATEADYTVLCREKREPQNLPTPRVLGAFAVLETRF